MTSRFHERFEIPIDMEEAKRRFANRLNNLVLINFWFNEVEYRDKLPIIREVASNLGAEYQIGSNLKDYFATDFHTSLQALEALYKALPDNHRPSLEAAILRIFSESEVDLGVRWENGRFEKAGAGLLDEKLVNDPLRWLSDQKYRSVLEPYSKGIDHFLRAGKKPNLLSDVITDMYEALEALAKIVTGRDAKDLSANAQLFLKELSASEAYKNILKEYIAYANNFRHGASNDNRKPNLTSTEVESFIYLTGLFIRLVMQH